jgi:hypothetical protein
MRTKLWSTVAVGALLGCASPSSLNNSREQGEKPTAEEVQRPVEGESKEPRVEPLQVVAAPAAKDPVTVESLTVKGDTLEVSVMHGGGCAEHSYALAWSGQLKGQGVGPAQAELVLVHDGHGDMCKALVRATPSFDLRPLVERWRAQGRGASGKVELRLGEQSVVYGF